MLFIFVLAVTNYFSESSEHTKFNTFFNLKNYYGKTQPESFCFLSLTMIGLLDENLSQKKNSFFGDFSTKYPCVVSYFMDIIVLFPYGFFAFRLYCRH